MVNATGWNQLMNGDIFQASYTMYNFAFAGYFIPALIIVFELLLIIKTRNPTLVFVVTLISFLTLISMNMIAVNIWWIATAIAVFALGLVIMPMLNRS